MKKINISVPQLAIEFVSVVFAVLLALGLNSYKQSRDSDREAVRLKSAIISECRKNLIKIDSVIIKNSDYVTFLDSLVRLDPRDVHSFYFAYEFEFLTNSAWTIAQNNPAVGNIDQEFLLEVADIYHSQEFFHDFSMKTFENIGLFLANKEQLSEADLALSMYYNVGVMDNSATELKKDYSEFLDKYDPRTN